MNVQMLTELLSLCPPDAEIYACSPDDDNEDYFIERVRHDAQENQVFLVTSR